MPLISELVTKITAENSQFNKAVNESEGKVADFAKGAKLAAGISAAMFTAALGSAAVFYNKLSEVSDKYSQIYDNAQKIGVSSQRFQEIAHVAGEAGVSVETLQKAFAKMNLTLGQAASGNKTAIAAFENLGLSVKDLLQLAPEQRYIKIIQATRWLGDETRQTAGAFAIFGKSASEQIGIINSDIEQSITKFKKLNATLSDDQQAALDSFSETKHAFSETFGAGLERLLADTAPIFEEFLKGLMNGKDSWKGLQESAKSFAEITVSGLQLVITTVNTLGTALGGLKYGLSSGGQYIADDLHALYMKYEATIPAIQRGLGMETWNDTYSRQLNDYVQERRQVGARGFEQGSINGVGNNVVMESSLAPIAGEKFTTTALSVSLDSASKAAEKFAKAVDKSADDMITNALKGSTGTGYLLGKIVGKANEGKTIAQSDEFESLASDLINFSQNNSGTFENKRYQANSLKRLNNIASFAQQQGEDASAMREVIKSLGAFVQKQQGLNEVQKLDVTITPTKYAHIEWSLSAENKKIVDDYMDEKMSAEARGVAR
jgi:hypothetical protein